MKELQELLLWLCVAQLRWQAARSGHTTSVCLLFPSLKSMPHPFEIHRFLVLAACGCFVLKAVTPNIPAWFWTHGNPSVSVSQVKVWFFYFCWRPSVSRPFSLNTKIRWTFLTSSALNMALMLLSKLSGASRKPLYDVDSEFGRFSRHWQLYTFWH